MAKTTERIIRITVDASKAKKPLEGLEDKFRKIPPAARKTNKSLLQMVSSINILRTAMSALVVGTGISAIAKMSDAYTNLNSRIKLVTKTEEDRLSVIRGLNDVSTRTFTDLEANATLFNRISTSMKEYNIQAESVLAITEALSQTLRISGSTSQEAKSGIIQFTQGLAKGRFDGDELKNILEGNIRLQRIFADAMGVSTAKLKDLGAEGKITAEKVLPALVMELDKLREESKSIAPTIGGAFTVLNNNLTLTVGKILEVTKASEVLAGLVMLVADNLHVIIPMIGTVLVGALAAATPAILTFGAAFISANLPMIALVVSIGLVAAAVGLIFAAFWDGYPAFKQGLLMLVSEVELAYAKIQEVFAQWQFDWAANFGNAGVGSKVFNELVDSKVELSKATRQATKDEELYWKLVEENAKSPKVSLGSMKKQLEDLIDKLRGGKGGKPKKEKADPMAQRLKALKDELEMIGRVTRASKIQGEINNMTRVNQLKATKEELIATTALIEKKQAEVDLSKRASELKKELATSTDALAAAYNNATEKSSEYTKMLVAGHLTEKESVTATSLAWETYREELDKMQPKAIELTGFMKTLHDSMDSYSQTTAEGLVDMTELLFQAGAGWEDFGDIVKNVVKSIARDIAVMGTKSFITDLMAQGLQSQMTGAPSGGGGGSAASVAPVLLGGLSSASSPSAPPAPSFRPSINASPRINVVNVMDPSVVGEYLNTKDGEDTMVNVLSTSDSYKAI